MKKTITLILLFFASFIFVSNVYAEDFDRSAKILLPTSDYVKYAKSTSEEISLKAILYDEREDDNVQWAVRKGTCEQATNTVAGNVDGYHNVAGWDYKNFSYELKTSELDLGLYCFVFNPSETIGEDDSIRITRWFELIDDPNGDDDNDGVINRHDLCPGSGKDDFRTKDLGTNRWEVKDYGEKLMWFQNKPKSKKQGGLTLMFDLSYTYGCNGGQILDIYKGLGNNMEGHWKFGLSNSAVEDFHNDYDFVDLVESGKYFIETVFVDPDGKVYSSSRLLSGVNYILEASGTYRFANWGTYGIADAAWNYRSTAYAPNGEPGWYQQTSKRLQVWIGDDAVNWQPATYNPEHIYNFDVIDAGNPLEFSISDDQYADNSGQIRIDIYANIN